MLAAAALVALVAMGARPSLAGTGDTLRKKKSAALVMRDVRKNTETPLAIDLAASTLAATPDDALSVSGGPAIQGALDKRGTDLERY